MVNVQPDSPLSVLLRPWLFWFSLAGALVCTGLFQWLSQIYQLQLLDAMWIPEQARSAIATMSEAQRSAHIWITGTLDVVYPMLYGLFFINAGCRYWPKLTRWIVRLCALLVLSDLLEGVVQLLALLGWADLLVCKLLLTPAKLALFGLGLMAIGLGLMRRLISPQGE